MSGLCRDCRHWHKTPEMAVGECALTYSPDPSFPRDDPLRRSKARVSFGLTVRVLECDPDFGCVQFEAKG